MRRALLSSKCAAGPEKLPYLRRRLLLFPGGVKGAAGFLRPTSVVSSPSA